MNTNDLTALRTLPLFLLLLDKTLDAVFLDVLQVLDHAHTVLGSVPFIDVFDPLARITIATTTMLEIALGQLFTVFDLAARTGFYIAGFYTPAAGACIAFSDICHA